MQTRTVEGSTEHLAAELFALVVDSRVWVARRKAEAAALAERVRSGELTEARDHLFGELDNLIESGLDPLAEILARTPGNEAEREAAFLEFALADLPQRA